MRRWSAVFALVAAVAVCSAASSFVAVRVVLATIPDANKVIHACYATATGDLRVIDSPATGCKSNETAIAWSQSGISEYEIVKETRTATTGAFTVANAKCSAGNSLLGGGYHTNNVPVHQSFPQTTGSNTPSWQVAVTNPSADEDFTAYAICARLGP
jgi:hypothetical protein